MPGVNSRRSNDLRAPDGTAGRPGTTGRPGARPRWTGGPVRAIVCGVTLDEVFKAGHSMALIRNPLRRAVEIREPAEAKGFWLVPAPVAVAALAKKTVDPDDLDQRVDAKTAASDDWSVDYSHCWCKRCSESRRLSQTSDNASWGEAD